MNDFEFIIKTVARCKARIHLLDLIIKISQWRVYENFAIIIIIKFHIDKKLIARFVILKIKNKKYPLKRNRSKVRNKKVHVHKISIRRIYAHLITKLNISIHVVKIDNEMTWVCVRLPWFLETKEASSTVDMENKFPFS